MPRSPAQPCQQQTEQQRDHRGRGRNRSRILRRIMLRRHHVGNRRAHRRNQQSMRINAVRGARHQRHPVFAGNDLQLRRIVRFDHRNAIHLVAERAAHHFDVEVVAYAHFIQSGEHHRVHKPAMPGDYGMSVLAAHRQTTAIQMPRTGRECRLRRAMVDRQFHRNFRNADSAHHTAAGIQQALIFRIFGAGAV